MDEGVPDSDVLGQNDLMWVKAIWRAASLLQSFRDTIMSGLDFPAMPFLTGHFGLEPSGRESCSAPFTWWKVPGYSQHVRYALKTEVDTRLVPHRSCDNLFYEGNVVVHH